MGTARWYFAGVVRPNSNVLVTGGYTPNTYLRSCELYDPSTTTWSYTGSMLALRAIHTATLLPSSDTVLVAGGTSTNAGIGAAEKWASSTWTLTGSMVTARYGHVALSSSNAVFVAGGDSRTSSKAISNAEEYDTSAGTWSSTGSLVTGRRLTVGGVLTDARVVIFGGKDSGGSVLKTSEILDPGDIPHLWSSAGSMNEARSSHNTTILPTGNILISGGYDGTSFLSTTEQFDGSVFSSGTSMGNSKANHGSIIMYDGYVLTVGGESEGVALDTTEFYRNVDATWTLTGSMNDTRRASASILINTDKVLTTGGLPTPRSTCELFSSSTWTRTGSMSAARYAHSVVQMTDGKIMAVGGWDSGGVEVPIVELYDVSAGTWSTTGSLVGGVAIMPVVVLSNGNVLVVGGYLAASALPHSQLYSSSTWALTGSMNTGRYYHGAVYLSNGKVLTAAGTGGGTTAELYNSATWTYTGSCSTSRAPYQMFYLPNGKVLMAGGSAVCELYNVTAGTWANTGSLSQTRNFSAGVLLANGKVLMIGGTNGGVISTAEIYDPATGTWTLTGSIATARSDQNPVLLTNSKILAIGGYNDSTQLSSVEMYNPVGTLGSGQPTITSVEGGGSFPVDITKSATIDIIGTNFKGATEGSNGRFCSSSAAVPIVFLKRVTDEACEGFGGTNDAFFMPISSSWTASTSLTFTAPSTLQSNGYYQLRVIVNGIASSAKIVRAID
ncbi:MAG: hypothetical protein HY606_01550 [Planctomycetes bacterium]|nr:hypothetical protein [Planctomycetota bacterium]